MPQYLDNPASVTWSHSHSTADFYELPTEGNEMHEALGWLLQQYDSVKLWMGVNREEGTEFLLIAKPSMAAEVVERLRLYDSDELPTFGVALQTSGVA